jgi:hypothetical protein
MSRVLVFMLVKFVSNNANGYIDEYVIFWYLHRASCSLQGRLYWQSNYPFCKQEAQNHSPLILLCVLTVFNSNNDSGELALHLLTMIGTRRDVALCRVVVCVPERVVTASRS